MTSLSVWIIELCTVSPSGYSGLSENSSLGFSVRVPSFACNTTFLTELAQFCFLKGNSQSLFHFRRKLYFWYTCSLFKSLIFCRPLAPMHPPPPSNLQPNFVIRRCVQNLLLTRTDVRQRCRKVNVSGLLTLSVRLAWEGIATTARVLRK